MEKKRGGASGSVRAMKRKEVGCCVGGSLPSNMCEHFPVLTELSLSYNYLEGPIPTDLHGCKSIIGFDLASNRLSGSIPKGIGNLTTLQRLYLGYNNLAGEIPEEIGNLNQLEILSSANNSLHGMIPIGLFNISSLNTIGLSFNQLSGTLPSNLGNMLPNLEVLHIAVNLLEGSIPRSISNSSKLQMIGFTSNKFSGPIPNSIGDLRVLKVLNLADNHLTKEPSATELGFIDLLSNCINLRNLDLRENPFDATLPRSIGNLSTSLIYLSIRSAKLKGNIPIQIGNLKKLQFLDFGDNDLTGQIPTTIGGLKELQILYLEENKLEGPFPNALCELTNLGILSMGNNKISGSIPKCIGNVLSLREIGLSENRLSSTIPESLWNLKDVLKLYLSHNSLIGNLSSKISSFRAITELELSNNLLLGNLPIGIGDLLTLTYLSLSHNGINGSIPDVFDKLVALEHLDLSSNNLSGVLPKSIEKLKFLTFFNVSSNQLGGQILEGGQFHNFTYESFMSNKDFCGAPWLNFPPCPREKKSDKKKSLIYVFISLAVIVAVFVPIVILVLRKFQAQRDKNLADPSLEADTSMISYLELRRATNGFTEENLIGTGGFGSVYKATLSNGEVYAVKVFHSQHEGAFTSFERECEVLRNIRHRNIAKVISSCSNLDFKSLILQYMPNGSLESWLYSNELFLDFLQRLDLMIDVGCALEYLHHGYTTPVVHCDLKPSNVLIDSDMVAHVTDFGISRLLGDNESFLHTITLATFGYMAPEYGTDGLVSTKCDVYSFGIMLLEVFTRKKPSDEMFNEGSSLRSWVSDAASGSLFEVIDTTILQPDDEFSNKKLQAANSLIELGLNCSLESHDRRPNMIEALATLKKIKRDLI
ncbi:hypothetical protein LIER_11646 [Lithospermum erythrorhizon]|uniref:non-specific serine/threonine protein kinase n=1 Tax=Lithospermum erythrorhizon TaxID=34254 RepID=A0AAV3PQ22_LITER